MKTIKRKGFTLVELLVVIAILAILATVSVVGYTSFIESANVSVDENLAAQLNNFLAAYKVNNPGDINEHNVRSVTAEILELGGVEGGLVPKSKGRNFYFDFAEQKYVVKEDDKVANSPAAGINLFIHAENPASQFLGSCFTENGNYFIVSTGGNDLAELVNGFYSIDNTKDIDLETLNQLVDDANALIVSHSEVANFVASSAIVHQDKKYHVAEQNKYLIIPDNANQIGGTSVVLNQEGEKTDLPLVSGQTDAVSIPDNIKYIASSNLNNDVKLDMTGKTAEEVADLFVPENDVAEGATEGVVVEVTVKISETETVTVKTEVKTEDGVKVSVNVVIEEGKEPINCTFANDLVSFDGEIVSGNDKKYAVNGSNAYIAWEKGNSITLGATNLKGSDESLPITSGDSITWDVHTDSAQYVEVQNNVVTLLDGISDIPDELKFVGTANNGKTTDYTVKVVYVKSLDYTIDTHSVTEYKDGLTLVYGENGKTTFDLVQVDFLPNMNVDGIELAPVVTVTGNNNFTLVDGQLKLASGDLHGEYDITINTEGYPGLKKDITLDIFNTKNLSLTTAHNNHKYIGTSGTVVTLGDLFASTEKEIPADAKVLVYTVYGGTKFTLTESDLGKSDLAKLNLYDLNSDWSTTPVEFASGAAAFNAANQYKVAVTIVYQDERGNYIRVADNHELMVIDGVNVTSYSQINGNTNNILYSDVAFGNDSSPITIAAGKTLYGSGYSIDMTGFDDDGEATGETFTLKDLNKTINYVSGMVEGLITLNGTLSNVKVVGDVYLSTNFIYQDHLDFAYGSSLVKANNGAHIVDCYLANTRSPLRTSGEVTVEDTVLFGGNYANIDVTDGTTLILKGDVTTINQKTADTPNTVGLGIAVDIFADYETTSIEIDTKCNLTQYNYISRADITNDDQVQRMAIVTYGLDVLGVYEDINVFLSDEIEEIFDSGDYDDYLFTHNNVKYANAGIVFVNGLKVMRTLLSQDWMTEDKTEEFTDARTGNGQQIEGLKNYQKLTVTAERSKDIKIYRVDCYANVYLWTPDKDTVTFNNTVPVEYLPSNVLAN